MEDYILPVKGKNNLNFGCTFDFGFSEKYSQGIKGNGSETEEDR
jgi:hypothetical protein